VSYYWLSGQPAWKLTSAPDKHRKVFQTQLIEFGIILLFNCKPMGVNKS
jgi:hypothetical protein